MVLYQTVDTGGHGHGHSSKQVTMTGFTTAYDYNLVVLAACQGKRSHVVNIGLGVKRLSADGVPVQQWAQSQQHKVCPVYTPDSPYWKTISNNDLFILHLGTSLLISFL